MCDIHNDNSIHVTDVQSQRVFRLREITAEQAKIIAAGATSSMSPAQPAVSPEKMASPMRTDKFITAPLPIGRTETKPDPSDPTIGRQITTANVDDVIADVFERTMDLYTDRLNPDKIVNELLDLAMEKIPCDAGSFYVADISSHDLKFAAVRGPKATEILAMGISVPMGTGIAGFCAQEGVTLSVSDALNDSRFAKEISERIGYDVHSTLCVSLEKDGRCYGAMQLINRRGGSAFATTESLVLDAIGKQAVELLSKIQT
jgi:hypothetical protein